ncbi:hypothetical protein EVS84_13705, partial [Pseudomonas koreensis]
MHSRASPLPQVFTARAKSRQPTISSVGAGLLAKTAAHSTSSSPDPAHSRASPLPQVFAARAKSRQPTI